jgi:hypothetical protein
MVLSAELTAQALDVVAALGIADRLAGGPVAIDDIAAATGAHQPSLYRLHDGPVWLADRAWPVDLRLPGRTPEARRLVRPLDDPTVGPAQQGRHRGHAFSVFRTVVDVGGQGSTLAAVLGANPSVQGSCLTNRRWWPVRNPVLRAAGVADGCEVALAGELRRHVDSVCASPHAARGTQCGATRFPRKLY